MRKSARTQIPPFFDNDPYISVFMTNLQEIMDFGLVAMELTNP